MKALLIPIKEPPAGKTRLAPLLSAEERESLARVMLEDVIHAVRNARKPDRVAVVSSSDSIIGLALNLGWSALAETRQTSESASVDWASHLLGEWGFDVVMRLPADVPLVKGEDIDALVSVELSPSGALLVPSRDGTGTNAILRSPATLFPSPIRPELVRVAQARGHAARRRMHDSRELADRIGHRRTGGS